MKGVEAHGHVSGQLASRSDELQEEADDVSCPDGLS